MNIEPHNLIDPLREKFPHLIRHEKLYRMIHRQLILKSATPFPKCYLHKEEWTFDS